MPATKRRRKDSRQEQSAKDKTKALQSDTSYAEPLKEYNSFLDHLRCHGHASDEFTSIPLNLIDLAAAIITSMTGRDFSFFNHHHHYHHRHPQDQHRPQQPSPQRTRREKKHTNKDHDSKDTKNMKKNSTTDEFNNSNHRKSKKDHDHRRQQQQQYNEDVSGSDVDYDDDDNNSYRHYEPLYGESQEEQETFLFIRRILKRTQLSCTTLIVALIYIDRFKARLNKTIAGRKRTRLDQGADVVVMVPKDNSNPLGFLGSDGTGLMQNNTDQDNDANNVKARGKIRRSSSSGSNSSTATSITGMGTNTGSKNSHKRKHSTSTTATSYISGNTGEESTISWTGIPLFLAAVICADKYLFDATFSNAEFSDFTRGAYSCLEINELERKFLGQLQYKLYVEETEFDGFLAYLEVVLALKKVLGRYGSNHHHLSYSDVRILSQRLLPGFETRLKFRSYQEDMAEMIIQVVSTIAKVYFTIWGTVMMAAVSYMALMELATVRDGVYEASLGPQGWVCEAILGSWDPGMAFPQNWYRSAWISDQGCERSVEQGGIQTLQISRSGSASGRRARAIRPSTTATTTTVVTRTASSMTGVDSTTPVSMYCSSSLLFPDGFVIVPIELVQTQPRKALKSGNQKQNFLTTTATAMVEHDDDGDEKEDQDFEKEVETQRREKDEESSPTAATKSATATTAATDPKVLTTMERLTNDMTNETSLMTTTSTSTTTTTIVDDDSIKDIEKEKRKKNLKKGKSNNFVRPDHNNNNIHNSHFSIVEDWLLHQTAIVECVAC